MKRALALFWLLAIATVPLWLRDQYYLHVLITTAISQTLSPRALSAQARSSHDWGGNGHLPIGRWPNFRLA